MYRHCERFLQPAQSEAKGSNPSCAALRLLHSQSALVRNDSFFLKKKREAL
jgi:hypothetical protein